MKKRTKKKLKKAGKKLGKGLAKLIFVYPAKGVAWCAKKSFQAMRKKAKKKKQEIQTKKRLKKRADEAAKFDAFSEVEKKKGSLARFEERLFTRKSMIGIILGARGSGKSAIGMRLLENFKAKTSKKIYAMGFDDLSLPRWITSVSHIDHIDNNSVILIDEGGIEFSSRKSMSDANTILSEILLIARHKDLSVLFITQNSSNLEINAIRQTDFLILKPSSLLQKDFERKKIKDVYIAVQEDFDRLKIMTGITYIYSDAYQGFITNTLPSFWNDKVSKGYATKH